MSRRQELREFAGDVAGTVALLGVVSFVLGVLAAGPLVAARLIWRGVRAKGW